MKNKALREEEETKLNIDVFLKKYIQYLPILYVGLVVLSISFNYVYFNEFNIKIINYIELSQLIIYPFEDYLIFVYLLFISITYSKDLFQSTNGFIYIKGFSLKADFILGFIVILLILIPFTFSIVFNFELYELYTKIKIFKSIISIIIVGYLFLKYLDHKQLTIPLTIIIMLFIKSLQAQFIREGTLSQTSVSFTYDKNKNINTNNYMIFIGETNKYIFIFNKKKNETTVYDRKDITNFKIKKRRKSYLK